MFPDHIDWNDPADITRWLDYLRQKLRTGYSGVIEDLLEAAIVDALVHYERHPECFDASRGSLSCYLWWRARHYLDKQLQKEKCHCKHEEAAGVSDKDFEKTVSEVRGRRGIDIGRESSEEEGEDRREEAKRRKAVLYALLPLLNSHDRCGVYLFFLGASREEWVEHLGIEHLPQKEQHRKVNRKKERLIKKLKRRAQTMRG